MHATDYYAILGLDRKCTAEQIRTAYRMLAKQHHPDVNGGCGHSTARTRELNEAYEVLGDPEKRKAYDHQQAVAKKLKSHRTGSQPDISREVRLRIGELLHGTQLNIQINDPAGADGLENYSLTIPPETAPGTCFRMAREAGGCVRVKVRVLPDYRFQPRGSDLRCDLRIRAQRAAQGGTETLRGVTGNTLRVPVPRGVPRGEIVRIEGEGLPKPRGGRGDLLVRIVYQPEVRIARTKWRAK